MSWWVGLGREDFWQKVLVHKFSRSHQTNFVTATDDDGYVNKIYKGKQSNPWYAKTLLKQRRDSGFSHTGGGALVLARDREGLDSTYEEFSDPVPIECTKSVRTIEADRAYREWRGNVGVIIPGDYYGHYYNAVSAAAELIVLLNHGYQPTDWIESEFRSWVAEHQEHVDDQLRLLD